MALRRASLRALIALAAAVAAMGGAVLAPAASAQTPQSETTSGTPPETARAQSDKPQKQTQSGRVPITGAPASLNADFKRLLRDEPKPETLFEARRQADRAAAIAAKLLESEGYFAAEVEPFAEGVEAFQRGVRVTPGPLFIYTSRTIDYLGSPPDADTQAELDALLVDIAPGVPADAQTVIDAGDAILRRLRSAGYPDARAEPVDALADGKQNTIDITFRLQPGLRASFGQPVFTGLGRTRQDFLEALAPWKAGERYSPEKLDQFRARLAETGLFSSAATKLSEDGAQMANGDVARNVEVAVVERKRRTIALGASASTSEGAGVEAEWELRNLTGRADALGVKAQIATRDSHLETTYRRPNIKRYGRNLLLSAKIENLETDAYDQQGGSVSATIEELLTPRLRGSLGVEAGYASIADQQTRLLGTGRRDLYILSSTVTAEYIGVRDVLDPANGIRARLTAEPGVTHGDTNIGFTRFDAEASVYFDISTSHKLSAALRGELGSIIGANGAPPDRLFFAGGGGSVRGYDYQSLSPRDATGELIGGRSLIETSAELRWRASQHLGYVAFIDAGAAGGDVAPPVDEMRAGIGVGVRYYAGFGPLRADIAIPLDKQEGDSDFQIYISIGQAF